MSKPKKPRYRQIRPQMYGSAAFQSLTQPNCTGQWLYIVLRTERHVNCIPGLFSYGRAALAERMAADLPTFDKAFAELEAAGLGEADWKVAGGLVYLPMALPEDPPGNPDQLKGWREYWNELPDCALKTRVRGNFVTYFTNHWPGKRQDETEIADTLEWIFNSDQAALRLREPRKAITPTEWKAVIWAWFSTQFYNDYPYKGRKPPAKDAVIYAESAYLSWVKEQTQADGRPENFVALVQARFLEQVAFDVKKEKRDGWVASWPSMKAWFYEKRWAWQTEASTEEDTAATYAAWVKKQEEQLRGKHVSG